MNQLTDIPVVVETDENTNRPSIQVRALLEELNSHISKLIDSNESGYVDLHSMPLMPGDIDFLKAILGAGEVKASVDALGETKVFETAIPAVWWISNFNTNHELISEFIEIAVIPEIMKTQHQDLHDANDILSARLKEFDIQ